MTYSVADLDFYGSSSESLISKSNYLALSSKRDQPGSSRDVLIIPFLQNDHDQLHLLPMDS